MSNLNRFQVTESGKVTHVSSWRESDAALRMGESLAGLVAIADDLDIYVLNGKRDTTEYVENHVSDVDLVLMNRSNIHSSEDIDGFEAVRLWRRYKKGDEQALQTLIKYNEEDIVNLKTIMEFAYDKMSQKIDK